MTLAPPEPPPGAGAQPSRPAARPAGRRSVPAMRAGEPAAEVIDLTAAEARVVPSRPVVPRQTTAPRGAAEACLDRAVEHLLGLQSPQGWWKGELETNVTMEAEDLLLRRFLGILDSGLLAATARHIRSRQSPEGTWATFVGGPPDLSTTYEAYVALRLAGDDPAGRHMRDAARFIRAGGGLAATRVFTRIWMALFGLWSWRDLPAMPPEVVLLPPSLPVSVYDFGCWARQTVVPLTVVAAHRPVRPLGLDLAELHAASTAPPRPPLLSWAGAFGVLDRALWAYERVPLRPLRERALRAAVDWVLDRQEEDGSWGGIQPPWVYSLLALHLSGHATDSPAMARGLAGLDRFAVVEDGPHGPVRRLEACQSPVWDTALAVVGLGDAGLPPDDPRMDRAARWLLAEEVRTSGDWAVRRPGLAPGGWAFEFANDGYPDTDDTAEVVLALRRTEAAGLAGRRTSGAAQRADPGGAGSGGRSAAARARGVAWLLGMQSRDGGWGAFDADNMRRWPTRLPFCDFGEVVDPPSADVTAHCVEMLCAEGLREHPATRRGVEWLLRAQEDDGSWFGRWGVNHVYGTGAAVPALVDAGLDAASPSVRRAVAWLAAHQHVSGGWGEDIRSYADPAWRGRGVPTASQTAWALLALLAAGERGPVVDAGVDWLVRTQRPDGTWDEASYTGTGFPSDFSINYHLYRLVFPVSALGRYLRERR